VTTAGAKPQHGPEDESSRDGVPRFHPLLKVYRFLRGDGSLTAAVVLLVLFIFVLSPLRELHEVGGLAVDLAFAAFLGLGAWFLYEPRLIMKLFIGFLAATVVLRVADFGIGGLALDVMNALFTLIASFLLGTMFITRALRDGRINMHRVMGAVGAFLLIGVMFSQVFRILALLVPDAFSVGGSPAPADIFLPRVNYFSFVTLTSLGYGDITPLHPFARALVVLEALTGQLFLAILVARLVAMELEWRHMQREMRHQDSREQE
jgi:hypothetical protein